MIQPGFESSQSVSRFSALHYFTTILSDDLWMKPGGEDTMKEEKAFGDRVVRAIRKDNG